jgi:hypothetical protein
VKSRKRARGSSAKVLSSPQSHGRPILLSFSTTFQVLYLAGAISFFILVLSATRARRRRIAGVLASVLVFTAISAPIDMLGYRTGLWFYPSCVDPPHPPLAVYVGQALIFVGGIALVGWRVQRRYGARGLLVLAAVVCGVGLVRDFSVAAIFPRMLRFGPAPAAELADVGAWAVVVGVALGVTRLVAGASSRDPPG